jgi:hypothetical protein
MPWVDRSLENGLARGGRVSGRSHLVIGGLGSITNGLWFRIGDAAVVCEVARGWKTEPMPYRHCWSSNPSNPSNPNHPIWSWENTCRGGGPRQVVGRVGKGGSGRFFCGCVCLASPADATTEFYHMPWVQCKGGFS